MEPDAAGDAARLLRALAGAPIETRHENGVGDPLRALVDLPARIAVTTSREQMVPTLLAAHEIARALHEGLTGGDDA